MLEVTIVVFFIVVFLLILLVTLSISEKYTNYLDHKSKCFDCERDIINRCGVEYAWRSQPAKSFDSEFEAIQQADGNPNAGYMAKTLKYY